MKNLVFSSLLLVGLSQATGCVFESAEEDAVHVQWNLVERLATDPPADNPIACDAAGVATIALHSLPLSGLDCDPAFGGLECVDLFDCSDLSHLSAPLIADGYTVWVDALDPNGGLIAQSFSTDVDVSGETHVAFTFPVDVGNYDLTWTLVDDTGAPETCANVGSGGVEIVATPVLNQTTFATNIFDCEDGGGMAIDNYLGENTVVVQILDQADGSLGTSNPRNTTLAFGNEVVPLGNFEFCFDTPTGPGCI